MEEKNIHEAINAIMKEVGYVQKQRGAGLTYSYAGEAALIEAVRPSMVEHGVYVSVLQVAQVSREQYTTAKGTAMINTTVHGIVRFTHVSGSFIDVQSLGEGADSGDKSCNKAMTGMYKYAIRQTFNIETGDDPDKFSSTEQERPAKQLTAPPKPEPKVVKPANELQTLQKAFGEKFAAAHQAGLTDVPKISGDSTAEFIKEKMAEIDAMMKKES